MSTTVEQARKMARFDFSAKDVPSQSELYEETVEPISTTPDITEVIPEPEMEPIRLPEYQHRIDIQAGKEKKEIYKRPGIKLLIGLTSASLVGIFAIALFSATQSKTEVKLAEKTDKKGKLESEISGNGGYTPDQQKIASLETRAASDALTQSFQKINEEKAAKAKADAEAKRKAKTTPTIAMPFPREAPTETYDSSSSYSRSSYTPPTYTSSAAPFRSTPSYVPAAIPFRMTPTNNQPPSPAQKPKMVAFGAMPDTSSSTPNASPVADSESTTEGYIPVAYGGGGAQQLEMGFSDEQEAFLNGGRIVQIQMESSAIARVTSGAILPNGFIVTLDSALGAIPAGSRLAVKPQTVYPDGKIEAYATAVSTAYGGGQRTLRIPSGTIQFLLENGNIPKAKKPSKGFFQTQIGQMLLGGGSALANQFLSTDTTISQTQAGTLSSSKAGRKDLTGLGLAFAKGSVDPLLASFQSQPTGEVKNSFVLEPSRRRYQVRALQNFTLAL
jgi:hypothetical protein